MPMPQHLPARPIGVPTRAIAPSLREAAANRRRHQRVGVALLGRYMLADRKEYPCQTVDISPGGVRLTCAVVGDVGERVVVYLEHLGRLEGTIVRHTAGGFAVAMNATARKRDKLASQLTWLANRGVLGLPEDRRHERVILRNPQVLLRLPSGESWNVRIIDCSLSGAAITGGEMPTLDTSITLGRTPCKVVRHFQGGAAVEFMLPLSPDRFDENLVL